MWIINLYIIENAITGLYLSQLSIYIGLIVLRAAQCYINSKCLLIVASLGNIYSTDDVFASLAIQKHRIDMNCNDLLSFFHYKLSDYPVFFEYDVPFDCKSFERSFQENTHIMGLSCKRFMCFVFRECLQQT